MSLTPILPVGGENSPFLLARSDKILVTGASSQVGEILTITFQFYDSTRKLWFQDQIKLNLLAGDRSVQTVSYDVNTQVLYKPDCDNAIYLTDLSISALKATTRGQTFARVNLNREGRNGFFTQCAILSDYVTSVVTACLRNSRHFISLEGEGNLIELTTGALAAKTDWQFQVPANARWKPVALLMLFASDATAGTRIIRVLIQHFNAFYETTITQQASLTTVTSFMQGCSFSQNVSANSGTSPLPDTKLFPGSLIASSTTFIGAADGFGPVNLLAEEWLDQV